MIAAVTNLSLMVLIVANTNQGNAGPDGVKLQNGWLTVVSESVYFSIISGQLVGATDFKLIHNHGASALNIDMNILSNFHKLYLSESVNQSLKNIRFENCL